MRIKHRVPVVSLSSAVLAPEYAAEVERHTARGERAYAKAQAAMLRAERRREELRVRLACERASSHLRREMERALAAAELEVERRREELRDIHRMMRGSPSSQAHRGRGKYRPPVPQPGEIL